MANQYDTGSIGGRIRLIREALDERKVDIYTKTGITPSKLGNWESNRNPPTEAMLRPFVRHTRATRDYIYYGNPAGMPHDLWVKIMNRLEGNGPKPPPDRPAGGGRLSKLHKGLLGS